VQLAGGVEGFPLYEKENKRILVLGPGKKSYQRRRGESHPGPPEDGKEKEPKKGYPRRLHKIRSGGGGGRGAPRLEAQI